jgi:hypothetical protein
MIAAPSRRRWPWLLLFDHHCSSRDIEAMDRELIRQHLKGQGPFIIRTSDGKQFSVPHPEFVLVGRHNLVIEHPKGMLDIVHPLHVVSIRPAPRRKAAKG